jgi:hypothetical protein
MAYTYSKIATYTVGSGGVVGINFINIPQNYTDLLVKCSIKGTPYDFNITFNNTATTGYSDRVLYYVGGIAPGSNSSSNPRTPSNNVTANTFSNNEIYIPNYTSSNYKSVSIDGVSEENGVVSNGIYLTAGLWSSTEPITSIRLLAGANNAFDQYSTAHLYGIKAEI